MPYVLAALAIAVLVAAFFVVLLGRGSDSLGATPRTPSTGKFDVRKPFDLFR